MFAETRIELRNAGDTLLRQRKVSKVTRLVARSLAVASMALAVVLIRFPTFFNSNPLNPDEAELLATGLLAADNFEPYENYTTTNFGFLWPSLLGALQKIGIVTNFNHAHVLSALFLLVTIILVQSSVPSPKRRLFILVGYPCAIAWAYQSYPQRSPGDFASLTTESASILMIALGFWLVFGSRSSQPRIFLGHVALGLAPWFKYQALPLCLVVSVAQPFLLAEIDDLIKRFTRFRLAVGGFLVGLLLPLSVLGFFGRLDSFYEESLTFASRYARGGVPGFSVGTWEKLEATSSLFFNEPLALMTLLGAGFLLLRNPSNQKTKFWATAIVLTGILVTGFPGNLFKHYTQYSMIGILLALALSVADSQVVDQERKDHVQSVLSEEGKRKQFLVFVDRGLLMILVAILSAPILRTIWTEYSSLKISNWSRESLLDEEYAPHTFVSQQCPALSNVIVWGWSPQEYLIFDWRPAARQVHTVQLQRKLPDIEWAETDMDQAIRDPETDCLLEAIGPNYFGGFGVESGIEAILPAETVYELKTRYERSEIPGVPEASLWIRKKP
jgi:hypothetical protein